jgi:hypothetical protein
MKFITYNNIKADRPHNKAVWLQDYGWVLGCDATEVKPGMFMFYNGGGRYEVLSVAIKGKTAEITMKTSKGTCTQKRRGLVPAQEVLQ